MARLVFTGVRGGRHLAFARSGHVLDSLPYPQVLGNKPVQALADAVRLVTVKPSVIPGYGRVEFRAQLLDGTPERLQPLVYPAYHRAPSE